MQPGNRLGPYEITGAIGAGGMGQVYSARDTRLDRSVAIKILPDHFAGNAQLRARFEREAKVISQLSHPNICTIHDVGRENGVDYLVMELLQGETLADRLAHGPLPLDQMLRYGVEIADALDKAHRHGIVHRDLKPGNIMITKSGAKLLDFGLARMTGTQPGEATVAEATEQKPLTAEGVVVGTYQYMAPEQLAGEIADHRTDIFALGAVLYEMATGRRAFEGKSRTSVIAAILSTQPQPLAQVQPLTPPALEHVISKALEKDPDHRWQSAHDLASELKWIATAGSSAGLSPLVSTNIRRRQRLALMAAAVLLITVAALALLLIRSRPEPPRPVRLSLLAPELRQVFVDELGFALSPDGSTLAFTGWDPAGRRKLLVRDLGSATTAELPGTEDAHYPFWSPDGNQLAFFADGKLKRIDLRGGSPSTVCDAPSGRGGTWGPDGTILFAPNIRSGIYRVPAAGGKPMVVIPQDSTGRVSYRWPVFLPDGRHFLYATGDASGERPTSRLNIAATDGSGARVLIDGAANAVYAEPGYLLFGRGEDLFAQRFDLDSRTLGGEAVPLVPEKIGHFAPKTLSLFSAAGNTIVHLPELRVRGQLYWYNRGGQQLEAVGRSGQLVNAQLSPDGTKVAVVLAEGTIFQSDLWIFDVVQKRETRVTYARKAYGLPRWSADGKRLMFYCQNKVMPDICVLELDGGEPEVVIESPYWKLPGGWLPDGSIVYAEQRPTTNYDVLQFNPSTGQTVPIAATSFEEGLAEVSPDGRFVAYLSKEPGGDELFLRSIDANRRWQISRGGANSFTWGSGGREILFYSPDRQLHSVRIERGGPAGEPQVLFEAGAHAYPAGSTADGQRILMAAPAADEDAPHFQVILNWQALLDRR